MGSSARTTSWPGELEACVPMSRWASDHVGLLLMWSFFSCAFLEDAEGERGREERGRLGVREGQDRLAMAKALCWQKRECEGLADARPSP